VYFKFSVRKHPQTGKLSGHYRLVESYRNADNRVCHRTILNVGFMEDATADQLTKIQPFVKRKSVVHKLKPEKTELSQNQLLLSG
jgi:hypothetical protein